MLDSVISKFEKAGFCTRDSIVFRTHDEFMFEMSDETQLIKAINLVNSLELDLHLEYFNLKKLVDDQPFFVKEYLYSDRGLEYKLVGVPGKYFAQAYRYYHNQPITENDLRFHEDGQDCKFLKPLQSFVKK